MINQIIISVAAAWVLGKIIKLLIDINKKEVSGWKILFSDGGMPSLHTIIVVSLCASLYLLQGVSALFFVCFVLALIVINDALKVRWITGEQSKIINRLAGEKQGFDKLDERVGHKPLEVLVGIILGVLVPLIVSLVF